MTLIRFDHVPIREGGDPLVDLSDFPIIVEPAYFKRGMSTVPSVYTRESVANKLVDVQHSLGGLRIKVWDAYRPRSVQEAIYRAYWMELHRDHPEWGDDRLRTEVGTFVTVPTDPQRIPPHATGGAIDLTVTNADGEDLDMGTGFDHFGPESASMYFEREGADLTIRENRRLLRDAMTAEEFRVDDEEWWHFDYGNQLWAYILAKPHAVYGEVANLGYN